MHVIWIWTFSLNLPMVVFFVLGSSQFQEMTEPPQKVLLTLQVVKNDTKIIISLLLPGTIIIPDTRCT